MAILKLEPYSGISGDMFLGAMAPLADAENLVISLPKALGLENEVSVEFIDVDKNSILCRKAQVKILNPKDTPHKHEHTHSHHEHHEQAPQQPWQALRSGLGPPAGGDRDGQHDASHRARGGRNRKPFAAENPLHSIVATLSINPHHTPLERASIDRPGSRPHRHAGRTALHAA